MEKRKEFKPKEIRCLEGVWILEALYALGEKEHGIDAPNQKVINWAIHLIEILQKYPEIEIFTIDSYSGQKKPFDRDLLRSKGAIGNFLRGYKSSSGHYSTSSRDGSGEYIFINRTHFERFMNGDPIIESAKIENEPKNNKTPLLENPKPLHTKEKDTLLKIIIGMAIGGYGYDPKVKRSGTVKDIYDDLLQQGISIDDDTIRKWLKEASEYLPRDA